MGDLIRSMIGYALVIALIVGGFKFYKTQGKATIESSDQSMRPEEYPYGSYRLNTRAVRASDYKPGDVIAYYLNIKPEEHRVARVIAVEGDKLEFSGVQVKVNGKTTLYKMEMTDWAFPEIRIPRGCVFVLSDTTGFWTSTDVGVGDSMKMGPVPFYNIMGKLN